MAAKKSCKCSSKSTATAKCSCHSKKRKSSSKRSYSRTETVKNNSNKNIINIRLLNPTPLGGSGGSFPTVNFQNEIEQSRLAIANLSEYFRPSVSIPQPTRTIPSRRDIAVQVDMPIHGTGEVGSPSRASPLITPRSAQGSVQSSPVRQQSGITLESLTDRLRGLRERVGVIPIQTFSPQMSPVVEYVENPTKTYKPHTTRTRANGESRANLPRKIRVGAKEYQDLIREGYTSFVPTSPP